MLVFLIPLLLRCTLIDTFLVSQGGVGSTAFMSYLSAMNVTSNDSVDKDKVNLYKSKEALVRWIKSSGSDSP